MYKLMRLLRTVRYVPLRMWWARFYTRIRRMYYGTPLYPILTDKEHFPDGALLTPHPIKKGNKEAGQAIAEHTRFTFNGETHALKVVDGIYDWLPEQATHLWQFHLHYWEWLADLKSARKAKEARALVQAWLLQCDTYHPVIWHPYPTSLRIVNALIYADWLLDGADDELVSAYWQSIQRQVTYLQQNLEWELEGNHLIKNIKALIYAGLCLPTRQSLFLEGQKLLLAQLDVQVLADGTHFERSPMYHVQVLEDVLEIYALLRQAGVRVVPQIQDVMSRMGTALQTLRHPHGGLALMHDGGAGDVKHIAQLLKEIDTDDAPHTLPDGGYVRLQHGKMSLLCDVGKVGVDDNPGHAHAQTLCFELCVDAQPVFVNRGTYAYQNLEGQTPKRQELRGTASHNTVQVHDENSAEVWGSFRVGRRPDVVTFARKPLADGGHEVVASHTGYKHLKVQHQRTWQLNGAGTELVGIDEIVPTKPKAKLEQMRVRGFFHLHPDVTCQLLTETQARLTLPHKKQVVFTIEGGRLFTQGSTYSGQMGEMGETVVLIIQPVFRRGASFSWKVTVL